MFTWSIAADDVPGVEPVLGLIEGEAAGLALGSSDVDLAMVGEASLSLAVFPQFVDGDECLGEAWYASYSSDEQLV